MNRRFFLKSLAASGMSAFAPSMMSLKNHYKQASAAVDYAGVNVVAPSVMPQVINIFLYGGPSELSGNLTNIVDIDANSQNSYTGQFGNGIIELQSAGGLITPNGFWSGAGGDDMQFMLDQQYMSVYRTIHKVKDPTRSHRESILMSLKGSLDVDLGAGVGARLGAMMVQHRAVFESNVPLANGAQFSDMTDPAQLPLPFVSFEGETRAFAPDPDFAVPLSMRYLTMDSDFDNPYTRANNPDDAEIEAIKAKVVNQAYQNRYRGVTDAFSGRSTLEGIIGGLTPGAGVNLNQDTSGNTLPTLTDAADIAANGGNAQLAYPQNNQYTDRIRAAVTLAVENPSSMYITVGGGLGGWDDHNNGVDRYPDRMQDLFEVLRTAALHIKSANGTTPGGMSRQTDNIIINVFGDFGRRVNLNNSMGWDHGNNQNLFTIGGAGVRVAGALGKVVGSTVRVGSSGTNNQVTEPASGSYQAEPMSIASSVYSYFGAQNPELITADEERNPNGDAALDETVAGEPTL